MPKSAKRVLDIFEFLHDSPKGATFTEIHEKLHIPKASLSALLRVLTSRRYVELDETDHYVPGIRLLLLSGNYRDSGDLVEVAEPTMRAIRDLTLETVNLATLEGGDVIFLSKKLAPQRLRYDVPVGWRMPAYASSVGKAMLSTLDDSEVDNLYPNGELVGFTPNTLRSVEGLKIQLQKVRRTGFAIDHEEGLVGVHAVGSAILDKFGKVVAGLSIAFPKARSSGETERKLSAVVKAGARIVSAKLGYNLSEPSPTHDSLKEIWAG